MTDAELLDLYDRERQAYQAYVATARGDTTNGRVLPSRVQAAHAEWSALNDLLGPERPRLQALLTAQHREASKRGVKR